MISAARAAPSGVCFRSTDEQGTVESVELFGSSTPHEVF